MTESTRQMILAAVVGIGFLGIVIELVRRRKLREEYAWLWIAAGAAMLIVGLSYRLLEAMTKLIGAGFTTSTLFFFGLLFLIALSLQFSVRISRLDAQLKNLAQQSAMRNSLQPNELGNEAQPLRQDNS